MEVEPVRVLNGVWMVDTHMYGVPRLSSVYLVKGDKSAVIDTGSGVSCESVPKAIKALGWDEDDVAYIVVTHIHLDHAGGAAKLLARLPRAKLAVHERGARHLADPARLVESVRLATVGEEPEGMEEMKPIARDRILPVKDGDSLDLGGRVLQISGTPGHAPHEICVFDGKTGGVFTGDTLGMYLESGAALFPNAVLPDFDLVVSLESIEKVRRFTPRALLFAHFGPCFKVRETIDAMIAVINRWAEVAEKAAREAGIEQVVPIVEEYGRRQIEALRGNGPLYWHQYRQMVPMAALAYEKHCKRKMGMI